MLFVRGGRVDPGDGLSYTGNNGRFWSSVSYNSSIAYPLYFDSGYVNPSSIDNRYVGFSIRCVALGG